MCDSARGPCSRAGDQAVFADVAALDRLRPGAMVRACVGDIAVALVNSDGHIHALGDLCLRCGGSLAAGAFDGTALTCAGCGWRYEVERGSVVGLPALRLCKFGVRVEGSRVSVAVPRAATGAATIGQPAAEGLRPT